MSALFDKFIERVLSHEGGYVNDPNDPGGETKWGISKRSYPHMDIAKLTRDDAKNVYRADFWMRVRGDELPAPIAFQALDFAVNSGVDTAIRKLQAAAGVADDGKWGPVTRAAVLGADVPDLGIRYLSQRLRFMAKLKAFKDFGSGWSIRIADNLDWLALDTP